jgi:hypothetical protein
MKCFCEIDYNLLTSVLALFVALVALLVSYMAMRYQIIGLISSQMADKAKECNSNLDPKDYSNIPKNNDKFSGILSAIITCEELLNYEVYHKGSIFLWKLNVDSLVDKFYLQLHTTVRVFVEKQNIQSRDLENDNHLETFNEQFQRTREFLKTSIVKNRNKDFERLRKFTTNRNNGLK